MTSFNNRSVVVEILEFIITYSLDRMVNYNSNLFKPTIKKRSITLAV